MDQPMCQPTVLRSLDFNCARSYDSSKVEVREFTFNRCPISQAGQMMTPDRESRRGVMSRRRSLSTMDGALFHDPCTGLLSSVLGLAGHDAARDPVRDLGGAEEI